MKTMYPPGYHHNGFVATHGTGMVVRFAQVHKLTQSHLGENCVGTSMFL